MRETTREMKFFSRSPAKTGLFLLALLALSGCWSTTKYSAKPVAQVNEHELGTKEFATRLARRLKDHDALTAKDPATIQNAKDEILKDFVTASLITDWCRSKKIEVSDADVDKEVEKVRSVYPDDLSFRRALAGENISFSEWRENLRASLLQRAFFAKLREKVKQPTEDEIKKYFEENRAHFKKRERIYLRQIVTDDQAKAEALKADIKKGDFAKLARRYSNAPEAKNGGLVGWVERGTVDFFEPAFSLPVNSVSNIVKSPFGYHIYRVEKKLPASAGSLDEARPEIVKVLLARREQAEFVAWLDGQIRSSRVLKDYALIQSIQVETRSSDD